MGGCSLWSPRRADRSVRAVHDGVAYCEDHDLGTYYNCLRGVRTSALERLGRWDEAAAIAETMLASVASPVNRTIPMTSLAMIVARQEAERADDARTGVTDPWLNGEIAAWLLRTGSLRATEREVAEPYRLQLAGDHRGAAELFDVQGCPYDAALALFDAPDELALRRSLDICDSLGAVATARIIRQKMRILGIRSVPAGPRAATRDNSPGLTRREQAVLELLGEGRTNAGIAAKLVISPKTVEHHVSAVLAKLGVSNWAEAAAARQAASPQ